MSADSQSNNTFPPSTPEFDDTGRWLINTPLLQFDHPKIRLLAKRLTQLKSGPA
jgi:hypothetical protein